MASGVTHIPAGQGPAQDLPDGRERGQPRWNGARRSLRLWANRSRSWAARADNRAGSGWGARIALGSAYALVLTGYPPVKQHRLGRRAPRRARLATSRVTLAIVIRGRAFPLVLTERTVKIPHESTSQEIRQRGRNPWIGLPKYDERFNGRLDLGAPTKSWSQHSYSYSDGAHWTLESRLGLLLQDLERLAAEAECRDREQELLEAERRRRWYAAITQARELQIEQQGAKALADQTSAWRKAAGSAPSARQPAPEPATLRCNVVVLAQTPAASRCLRLPVGRSTLTAAGRRGHRQ